MSDVPHNDRVYVYTLIHSITLHSITLCVKCMCVCKQLPGNQSFDKLISSHQKGGGVRSGVNGSGRQLIHAP